MVLRRFLGGSGRDDGPRVSVTPAGPGVDPRDTETVRRIVGELEAMPPERAKYLAAFAYILARAAAADLDISEVEMRVIEKLVVDHGGLPGARPDAGGPGRARLAASARLDDGSVQLLVGRLDEHPRWLLGIADQDRRGDDIPVVVGPDGGLRLQIVLPREIAERDPRSRQEHARLDGVLAGVTSEDEDVDMGHQFGRPPPC